MGTNDLQSMYVGDDEDLSAAYTSAANAPVVRAEPQATPQTMSITRSDARDLPKRIDQFTSHELQTLGRQQTAPMTMFNQWRSGTSEQRQAMERTSPQAVVAKGRQARQNDEIMQRNQPMQRMVRNQKLPNVPIGQLKPGHYSLDGVPNAQVLMQRGAKGILVRPDGRVIVLGIDGRNVDLRELTQGQGAQPSATGGPEVMLPLGGPQ